MSGGRGNVARDPGELYEVEPDAPETDDIVLLYYLDGFIDAGGAGRLLASHLLSTLDHQQVAAFDVDALIDYRSRRPVMTFAKDHWESYDAPELAVFLLHDTAGAPFLLLNGPEPDHLWEGFTSAVRRLSAELGVRLSVSFHGIPMGVPHTRPLGVTAHATQPGLTEGYRPLVDRLLVPGDALREAARRTDEEIARQVEGSDEVAEVVQSLEEQYDSFSADQDGLLGDDPDNMPTAEELGAEFE